MALKARNTLYITDTNQKVNFAKENFFFAMKT